MVLLVEDDETIRATIDELLDAFHVSHFSVSNVKDALIFVKANCPSILLIDFMLGGSSTAKPLVEHCKKYYPHCKSVMITAMNKVQAESAANELGVDHLLLKPFNIWELEDLLKQLHA